MWWGWKLLIFYGLSLLLSVIFSVALAILGKKKNSGKARVVITGREGAPAVLAVSLLMVAYLDRRPLASLGLHFYSSWWQELTGGILIGALMLIVMAVLLGTISRQNPFAKFVGAKLAMLLGHLRGALTEELTVRGYPFQVLIGAIGIYPAVFTTSVFFGLLHFQSQRLIGAIDTSLAGLLLATAVLKTNALWLAVGIHFGWNFLESLFGLGEESSRQRYLAEITVIIVFWVLLMILPIQPYPEMERLWQEYIQSTR